MKKRIRLHQLRVGMFVEELEVPAASGNAAQRSAFLLRTPQDVDKLLKSNVISLVINTNKGTDTTGPAHVGAAPGGGSYGPSDYKQDMLAKFSVEEIREARKTVEDCGSAVRSIFSKVRVGNSFNQEHVSEVLDPVMKAEGNAAAALIGIARMRNRDEATFLHSLAVSALMVMFGRSLGIDETTIKLLGFAGLVHDMGKMVLPLEVLNKPGKLEGRELDIMRSHPQRGYELLKKTGDMPQLVLDVCLYHHERYDGTGYPARIAGEKIPYAARLAAVCDVYDAMTAVRPYKRGWSQSETVDMMMRSTGHFDQDLLRRFVSNIVLTGAIV